MGHIGQELAFGIVGKFCFFPGFFELILCFFSLGNVANNGLEDDLSSYFYFGQHHFTGKYFAIEPAQHPFEPVHPLFHDDLPAFLCDLKRFPAIRLNGGSQLPRLKPQKVFLALGFEGV